MPESLSRGLFEADGNLRLAPTHLVQTMGEADRQVSPAFCQAHPEIPWAKIIAMRHRTVGDYLTVD